MFCPAVLHSRASLALSFRDLGSLSNAQDCVPHVCDFLALQVRDLVLQFFNADPAEYQVVFTRSATGALKLVGETFPWSK